jgi:SagB-type dehydrogenase family enzyme
MSEDQTRPGDFEMDALNRVRAYHHRTKHGFGRYALSPGSLDWETQPDPFRRFEEAPQCPLPLAADRLAVSYADLFTLGTVSPAPLDIHGVALLLELSFGLAAWKQYGGDRWALRCNPSSGNLHPTEAYAVASGVSGLEDGVHHYASHDHALERRCQFGPPFHGLLVGLSSIHWREAWKYGERAFRYCQHDIGHGLGALRYAAAALGWRVRLLDAWGDADIAALLGLDRADDFTGAEMEAPDLLCLIETGHGGTAEPDIDALAGAATSGVWTGRANALSPTHNFDWPVIDEVSAAARKPRTLPADGMPGDAGAPYLCRQPLPAPLCELPAHELIKQRRSAQAFDGVTSIPAKSLFRLLDSTLPRSNVPPFDAWHWPPRVHLVLFIHRVVGLPPGVYIFCRSAEAEPVLRAAMKESFKWETSEGCPGHLRLFRLLRADARQAATTLSCQQAIAGDSAFSLGMLAEFESGLAEGPWVYRRLFWECGLLGQALYLEAEAAGVRGTGIGCYFDDPVHELLGLNDARFQSLYHFTVGGPLVDGRLQSLPGYWHLQR